MDVCCVLHVYLATFFKLIIIGNYIIIPESNGCYIKGIHSVTLRITAQKAIRRPDSGA